MLTEDMIRRIQGADFEAEPERKWSKRWTIFYGWPAAIFLMGLAAVVCVAWRHLG